MKVLLACFTLALAGCSGSSSGGAPPAPQTVVWDGEWIGTFQSIRGIGGGVSVNLREDNGFIVATNLTVVGANCSPLPNGAGRVAGNQLTMSASMLSGGRMEFEGEGFGDTLTGNYGISGGLCDGDEGGFILTRTQN